LIAVLWIVIVPSVNTIIFIEEQLKN